MPLVIFGVEIGGIIAVILRFAVGYLITRTLLILGISLLVFEGINFVGNSIQNLAMSGIMSLPAPFINAFSAVGGFVALQILFSAQTASLAIRSLLGAYNKITFNSSN